MLLWSEIYFFMGAATLVLDYFTGPYLLFPIFFVLPVALSAWNCGPRTPYALAVLLPLGRLAIAVEVDLPSPFPYIIANAVIRILLLIFIASLVLRVAKQNREQQRKLIKLARVAAGTPLRETAPVSTGAPWISAGDPDSIERPEYNKEVIAQFLADCIDLGLWEQGQKVARQVHSFDWLYSREAAGRFWLAHATHLQSAGDIPSAASARSRILAIWPEGECELKGLSLP